MGHVVFAAPSIRRFHLQERLRRDLLRRGHRVSVLCAGRAEFTFWREQVPAVDLLSRRRGAGPDAAAAAALAELPAEDHLRPLDPLLPAAMRWLEREQPDLLLFHDERSPTHAALQLAARATGIQALWSGDGLLPHTLQIDERGLDGDASSRRCSAADYRVVTAEDALLDAALAHALAGGQTLALPRAEVRVPKALRRLLDGLRYGLAGRFPEGLRALHAWQEALGSATSRPPSVPDMTVEPPFVAALLQQRRDPRVVLDGDDAPQPAALVRAALQAAARFEPGAKVAVVLPPGASERRWSAQALAGADADRVQLVAHAGAAGAAATAAAVVTVNHPAAAVALLAGTPVAHTGRALYGLDGVTAHANAEDLPDAVTSCSRRDRPGLRRRFLTWLLRHGHVWCSPTAPNYNGVLGLVQAVERRLEPHGNPAARPLSYRPGPTWPLKST